MVLAIIQARMSSSRLPGKVLKPIIGRPMLELLTGRLRRCECVDGLIIATSIETSDDPIEYWCRSGGIDVFRGSLANVLDRYYGAAVKAGRPSAIVRVTGDCPLVDPDIVDQCVRLHLESGADYTSNVAQRTFPNGLDVEVFSWKALEAAWSEASTDYDREHVTPYIRERSERFPAAHLIMEPDLHHLRWTVDTQKDFDLVSEIFENLRHQALSFNMRDMLTVTKAADPDGIRFSHG